MIPTDRDRQGFLRHDSTVAYEEKNNYNPFSGWNGFGIS